MSVWDDDQDYAIDFFNVTVNSKVTVTNITAAAAHTQAGGLLRNGAGLITPANPSKLTALPRTLPAIASATRACISILCTGTLNFASDPALSPGDSVTLAGFSPGAWNGTKLILTTSGFSVTFFQLSLPAMTVLGTATAPALTFSATDVSRTITSSTANFRRDTGERVQRRRNGATGTMSARRSTHSGITLPRLSRLDHRQKSRGSTCFRHQRNTVVLSAHPLETHLVVIRPNIL